MEKEKKGNSMFIVFLVLSLVAVALAGYVATVISSVEVTSAGLVLLESSSIITLIIVLLVSLLAIVLCGFIGMNLYSRKALEAQKANRMKTLFFSRMSHDMRTPMTAIIGLTRMAHETDNMNEIKGHLETIHTSSNHLLNLINDVLDISRIESGNFSLDVKPCDLYKEINKTVSILVPELDSQQQELSLKIGENVPQYVKCDNTHLRQILVNLLSNAHQFTGEGGHIVLSVDVVEQDTINDKVRLIWHVKDNGVGMEKEMADAIFSPFDIADKRGSYEYSGTGLGLPIANQLVNMMGGSIGVASEIGLGSDFFFSIWVDLSSYEDFMVTDSSRTSYATIDLTGQTALLFEDLATNRLIAENVLSKMGATVEFALNGLQGVNMFIEDPGRYDIIFMDIKMPVMDGYEATRQIRNSGVPGAKTVPIVAMTANAFKEDAKRALAEGMNGHIGKPFDVVDVEKVLLDVKIKV